MNDEAGGVGGGKGGLDPIPLDDPKPTPMSVRGPAPRPDISAPVGRSNPMGLGQSHLAELAAAAATPPRPVFQPVRSFDEPPPRPAPKTPDLAKAKQRLVSLDVYRGLIMIVLALEATHRDWSAAMFETFPESPFWRFVNYHFLHHLPWEAAWVTIWDMIQPSFMFMVGVAMAYSYTKRKAQGHSWIRMFAHAFWRALLLILLGMLLRSPRNGEWNWDLMDVITQIGLGYVFLFLLWGRNWKIQMAVGALVLAAYYTWFALTPTYPDGLNLDDPALGLNAGPQWAAESGGQFYPNDTYEAHWQKNANAAHSFDVKYLNYLPRTDPHRAYGGGYTTLNFIPAFVTMLMGLMIGQVFRSEAGNGRKLAAAWIAGLLTLALGLAVHAAGIGPIIKVIWTPSWTLFSGGICLLFLGLLFLITDVARLRFWTWPLVVVGMNPITIYIIIGKFGGWIRSMIEAVAETIELGSGADPLAAFGAEYQPVVLLAAVVLVIWLIAVWMYRRGIFIRL